MGGESWTIEISEEVAKWYLSLNSTERARADRVFDLLRDSGPDLGMPRSRQLGDGLRELRFRCEDVERRITYYLDPERKAITLTTFRKQRQNERREVDRARKAMARRKRKG